MAEYTVDEAQILKQEANRILLRNNLRSKGVACSDNETIDSLANKVLNVPSANQLVNKTLTEYIDNTITSFSVDYFSTNTQLQKLECRQLTVMPNLLNCVNLREVITPLVTSVVSRGMENTACEVIWLPRCATLASGAFNGMAHLQLADIGNVNSLPSGSLTYQRMFGNTLLEKLIIRSEALCSNQGTTNFNGTPFVSVSGNAKLYVPSSLVGQYATATNWSTLYFTEISIEGSRFEDLDWFDNLNSVCILDGVEIKVLDDETADVFKHTENLEHIYEDGVEVTGNTLVKGKTLTTTIGE